MLKRLSLILIICVGLMCLGLVILLTAHGQTTGVIATPGKGLTFVYPGVGGSPTVIQPPTGPPSYYYPPAPMIQPVPTVPMVPTVPTLPSLYAPYAPAPVFGGF